MRISQKHLAQVSFAIGLLIASAGLPAVAQTRSDIRQGIPGRRISGGTRRIECMSSQPVVALTPADSSDIAVGDRTSLQFLLPEFKSTHPVEFKLRSQGTTVYTEVLSAGTEEKLVNIQLPTKLIEANQNYHWYFSVICDIQDRSQDIVLSGQLQVNPEIFARQRDRNLEALLDVKISTQYSAVK
ncbi:MAG: DUF928 domain-containing protein [Phormidesmis sp.]